MRASISFLSPHVKETIKASWSSVRRLVQPRPTRREPCYETDYETEFIRAIYDAGRGSPQSRLLARIALNVFHDPKKYCVNVTDLLALSEKQMIAVATFLSARATVPYKMRRTEKDVERFLILVKADLPPSKASPSNLVARTKLRVVVDNKSVL